MRNAYVGRAGSIALVLVLASAGQPALAGPMGPKANALWSFGYDNPHNDGKPVNDFHLRLVDPSGPINVVAGVIKSTNAPAGQSITVNPTFQGNSNNTKQVDMDWQFKNQNGNVNYQKGQKFTISLNTLQPGRNRIAVQNAYFTLDGVSQGGPGPEIGLPGFNYKDPPASELFSVTYGPGDPATTNWQDVWISNLQFMINQPEQAPFDTSFFSPNFSPTDYNGLPFKLAPGSASSDFTVTGFDPGTFIYVMGAYSDSPNLATANYVETFLFGHQTGVPEPGTLAIFGAGLFGVLMARRLHQSA